MATTSSSTGPAIRRGLQHFHGCQARSEPEDVEAPSVDAMLAMYKRVLASVQNFCEFLHNVDQGLSPSVLDGYVRVHFRPLADTNMMVAAAGEQVGGHLDLVLRHPFREAPKCYSSPKLRTIRELVDRRGCATHGLQALRGPHEHKAWANAET